MANMSIAPAPASTRLLPSDSAIFRVWLFEYNKQQRGAIARTARALNCSDQHVSNVIRRHQRPETPKVEPMTVSRETALYNNLEELPNSYKVAAQHADPLAYVPPPGAEELAQERARLAAQVERDRLLASLLTVETPTQTPTTPAAVANDYVNFSSSVPFALALEPRLPTLERAQAPRYELAIAKRTGPTAEQQQAIVVSRIAIGVAALLTLGVLLLGSRSVVAGLGLLPCALIGWHLAAMGRRVARVG